MATAHSDNEESEVSDDSARGRDSDADADIQVTVRKPCRYYNKGHCRDGDSCPYWHVCKYAVSGTCRHGSGCQLKHPRGGKQFSPTDSGANQRSDSGDREIPDGRLYQWQLHDRTSWKNIINDHVIEAQYCLPHTKNITIYNTNYGAVNIDFNTMTVCEKDLRVRRLDDGNTEWVWFCMLYSKWIKYGDKDPDGNPTPGNSSDIEQKFQSNPSSSYTFNIGAKTFEINFREMRQVSSDRKRRVARRPVYRPRRTGAGVPQGKSVSQNTSMGTKPLWQFEEDGGAWKNMSSANESSETSEEIERMFQQNPNTTVVFKANGKTYNLDFGAMIQTNLKTKFTRKIRRVLV